ncbi:HNH endonuclease [Castellaniella sp.]|uniref:HNH endonuclease n=1 Tax=Castellaniella sp. TaxID=1955812 RepID=UPI002AFE1E84|nr:HNH endonuclease [Castellaniella sp.]
MAKGKTQESDLSSVDLFDQIDALTVEDYAAALDEILPKITRSQLAMLVGHASAALQVMTMAQIAALGGYDSYGTANLQYGRLGRLFAIYFGINGLPNQVQALAYGIGTGKVGQFQWGVLPQLFGALVQRGLVRPHCGDLELLADLGVEVEHDADVVDYQYVGAALELADDPSVQSMSETERRTLVNARIGQGAYRRKLLQLWDGKCAVTGCDIRAVLVASHAKPWALSHHGERLDEYNGLLLSAVFDQLFDAGLISFSDSGEVLFAPSVSEASLALLGVGRGCRLRMVAERHKPYLRAHRKFYGFPG